MALNSISSIYAVECFKELCDLMCNSWTSELSLFLNIAGKKSDNKHFDDSGLPRKLETWITWKCQGFLSKSCKFVVF